MVLKYEDVLLEGEKTLKTSLAALRTARDGLIFTMTERFRRVEIQLQKVAALRFNADQASLSSLNSLLKQISDSQATCEKHCVNRADGPFLYEFYGLFERVQAHFEHAQTNLSAWGDVTVRQLPGLCGINALGAAIAAVGLNETEVFLE